ncbi:MAG: hypothetical protein IPH65_17560 [Dehalococcoidia bacterium]|uniref:hypothetical protein n=1 Tax=Candidatus Amarobacter glycogenicus TaxID=3140699 RepID=UPI0031357751|nr:hypothetical protein [Dehalococcoidia bacterium]
MTVRDLVVPSSFKGYAVDNGRRKTTRPEPRRRRPSRHAGSMVAVRPPRFQAVAVVLGGLLPGHSMTLALAMVMGRT